MHGSEIDKRYGFVIHELSRALSQAYYLLFLYIYNFLKT